MARKLKIIEFFNRSQMGSRPFEKAESSQRGSFCSIGLEPLESRRFLSMTPVSSGVETHAQHLAHLAHIAHLDHLKHLEHLAKLAKEGDSGESDGNDDGSGDDEQPVAFDHAPSKVQAGLRAILPSGIVIAPSQTVDVNTNDAGLRIYSIRIKVKSKEVELGVQSNGKAVKQSQLADNGDDSGGDDSQDGDAGDSD